MNNNQQGVLAALTMSVVAMTVFCAASAEASTAVTHFSNSISQVQSASTCPTGPCDPASTQQVLTSTGALTSTSRSLNVPEGSADAAAIADLSTGQLKTYSDAYHGSGFLYEPVHGYARADFGDSFRAYDQNGPFQWQSNTNVSFEIDLSGNASSAGGGENGSTLSVLIFEPGILDAYYQWLGGSPTYSTWSAGLVAEFNYWLGPDDPGYSWITETYTSFPSNISASFNPNGDFDWAIVLVSDSYASVPGASATSNFLNTATISYSGPAGTTTFSASGLFPGTASLGEVPVPSAAWLFSSGLLGLIGVARRKAARTA